MLQPLLEKSEALYFGINGQVITFAAQISFFLADMLEADDITVTYKGVQCKMPCYTCMVLQSDLNNMSLKLENVPHRTYENMKQVINNSQGKEYSVHSVENSFWKFPNLNIYEACIPDRMHYIYRSWTLQIPIEIYTRYFESRHLNVLTASDYRNIMKIALFALDEIFEGNEITCKELCELYAKFSKMYIMSRKEMYTEEDLKIFEVKHKELISSAKKVIHRKAKGFGKILQRLLVENTSYSPVLIAQSIEQFELLSPISDSNSYNHPIYLIIHQLVSQDFYNLIRSFTFNDKLTRSIIWKFLISFHEHIYQQIWPKHCSLLNLWELHNGITPKHKCDFWRKQPKKSRDHQFIQFTA
ncbi:hypothetical protein RhiirC2_796268 [Rhizophagus irregularis]|uniref:Uncharacterized protein n=1 Tax=Rhizophagus irregularis TaxID=588596 RepID=A0A2N1M9Z1_9GLOM|nr:hypothetical protein RhiirC2_796268 [Rhizophagus irregularis]